MDESVAFTQVFADKENRESFKPKQSKVSGTKKKIKKELKTDRSEAVNKLCGGSYIARNRDARVPSHDPKLPTVKRRVSHLNNAHKTSVIGKKHSEMGMSSNNRSQFDSLYKSNNKTSAATELYTRDEGYSGLDNDPICDDVSESDVYTDNFKNQTSPMSKPHKFHTFSSSEKYSSGSNGASYLKHYDTRGQTKGTKAMQAASRKVTVPFRKPKFMDNVQRIPKKVTNSFGKYGFK